MSGIFGAVWRALRNYHEVVKDEKIESEETIFVSSGSEKAVDTYDLDGYVRVDGLLTVKTSIDNSGTLNVTSSGEVELGDDW